MGRLNRQLPAPRAMYPFMSFEEVPIEESLRTKLEAPCKFSWNKGLISDVVFDGAEQPWSANIKRGVLNLLQVNLQKHRQVESERFPEAELSDKKSDFFRVTESTLEGECETFYTVTSQPDPFFSTGSVLNVTKSIDFERCTRRPEVKYNFRFSNICPTCDETKMSEREKFLKSSTVMKFNISGTPESFLIESARIESQYTIVPFSEESNVIITFVNQTLELFKSGPIETQIRQPRNPKPSDSDMIFSPDWDIKKEKFFMEGEDSFLEDTPFPEIRDKIELVSKLFRKFCNSMTESVDIESPRYFSRLVKVFRLLKKEELETVFNRFYKQVPRDFTPEEHIKIKNIFVDSCAFAGTKDCVFLLTEKIMKREIDPLMASLAIKAFPNIRVVSKEMIEKLFTLAESEVCRRNFFLRQSTYLTIGSLMNSLCVDNEDFFATEFKLSNPQNFYCPRELKEKFAKKLFESFEKAKTPEDQLIFMKTISNAGLTTCIPRLEKIIKNLDKRYPEFIRTEAILALRQLTEMMPHKVRQILMPLFMDRYESPELRIVCLYTIFQTQPARPILDQISRQLFSEKSRQVASFVFSYMSSMANSTNPCERRFATDVKLSLRHSRFIPFARMPGFSKMLHFPFFFPSMKFGFDLDFATINSNRSFLPRLMGASFSPVFGGFWSKNFIEMSFGAEGFESLLFKYLGERGFLFEKRPEELLRRSPRSVRNTPIDELKSLYETLKIRPREFFSEKSPKAQLSMRFKNQEFGFLPFNFDSLKESIQDMLESGSFSVREVERFLERGYHFKLFKAFYLHEMSYKIPTTFGIPIRFSAKAPVVFKFTGKAKADIRPNDSFKNIKVIFENFKPSFVSSLIFNVESWCPIVNSGVKIVASAKIFTPFKEFTANVNFNKKPAEFSFTVKPFAEENDFITLETRPVTHTLVWPKFVRDWIPRDEKTIMGEDWTRVQKINKQFGRRTFGLSLKMRGFWHRVPVTHQKDTPFCPFSGPNRLVFTSEPGLKAPKEFVMKVTADFFKPLSEVFKPEFRDFSPSTFEEERSFFEKFSKPDFDSFKSYEPSRKNSHFFKAEIFTKGSPVQRKVEFKTTMKCGERLRFCKFESQVKVSPIPEKFTEPKMICMEGETLFPENPHSFEELVGKKAISQFRFTFGSSCSSPNFVNFKVLAERSREQVEFERQSPFFRLFKERRTHCKDDRELCSPIFERESMLPFASLMNYRFDVDYQNIPPMFKNVTNKFFRFAKFFFFFNTEVSQINVRNPENKIRAFLSFNPFSREYFNFTVKTPKENAIFRDIPIYAMPVPIAPMNFRRRSPIYSSFMETVAPNFELQPVCVVNSRRISTFDKVEYTAPLSTCYSVLAKDCGSPDEPNFAILAKKLQESSEMKKIKIVTRFHRIELFPETQDYESIKIRMNGETFEPTSFEPVMEHGHVIVRIEKIGKFVRVFLPETGLQVFFDGYTAKIEMSEFYRNVACGLCGHFDRESEDEFRTPEFERTSDVRRFFRSFTVREESCKVPVLEKICSTPECEYRPFFFDNDKIDTSSEELISESPIRSTKVIEQTGKLCFSKVPVPRCPRNTYPTEFKAEKKVVYTCLPRSSFEAQEFARRAQQNMEYISELRERKSHFTETEQIPKKCGEFDY
jgi:hypothetical protein